MESRRHQTTNSFNKVVNRIYQANLRLDGIFCSKILRHHSYYRHCFPTHVLEIEVYVYLLIVSQKEQIIQDQA